jgi:hypothetical protein
MPVKIPRYSAQINPVDVSGNALVEHPEYLTEGMKGIGSEIEKAGQIGMRIAAQYDAEKQRLQDTIDKSRIQAEATKDHYETIQMFEADPDYAAYPDKLKTRQEELSGKYRGMVKNPKTWEQIQPALQGHFGIESVRVNAIKRRKEVTEMKDNIYEIGKDWVDIIGNTVDPVERDKEVARFDNFLNSVRGKGVTAKEADTMRTVTLEHSELKRIIRESGADPLGTQEKLRVDPLTFYPYLREEGLGKARAIASSAVADYNIKKKAIQDTNNNTATLIAMGDKYETKEGTSIPLTTEMKEQMLKTMLKDRAIDDNLFRTLMGYVKPSGGKPVREGNPSWGYMYNPDDPGDKVIVDFKDPDAVLAMMESGYAKGKPAKKKRTAADLLGAAQGNKGQTQAPANVPDPLGLRKKK